MQQYANNGSRAISGRVFPEYVCIEDVDKIISIVQQAPAETAVWSEPGKHLTASETRFTPIGGPTASVVNGKGAKGKMLQCADRRPVTHNSGGQYLRQSEGPLQHISIPHT